jgi:nucleoside-diphosphate-sugar epimerase
MDITNHELVFGIVEVLKPDYVVHLAAYSSPASKDLCSFYKINTLGTCNLLSALANLGTEAPKRVLLSSSANVYGISASGKISEDTRIAPVNHYGCSKASMEFMAQTFMGILNITIARPFNYTGKGQDGRFVIPKVVEAYVNREASLSLGDVTVVREFNDVRDVCSAYECLLLANHSRKYVNICSGFGYSITEVMALLAELTNHEVKVTVDPMVLRKSDAKEIIGDPTALLQIGRWKPKNRLRDTLGWMLGL